MTVVELISELQQMSPTAEIDLFTGGDYIPLSMVVMRPEAGRLCLLANGRISPFPQHQPSPAD